MKRILFRAFAILTGIVFTLAALELCLRINPRLGYNYVFSKKFYLGTLPATPLIQPSPLLGYEHIPNIVRYGGSIRSTNAYGLTILGKDYKLHKDAGTFRILVLGDSIAESGWGSEFLEDNLNNDAQLHTRYNNFEIWNAGVSGYDIRKYALYLKHKGLDYNPDMVLIFFCLNDFDLDTNVYLKGKDGLLEYYFSTSAISKIHNINPFFMKHSCLYRFIILRLNSYLLYRKGTTTFYPEPEETNGRYYLRMIKKICESKKIPLVAVIFPYLMPVEKYNACQLEQHEMIARANKELEINHLNLREYLPETVLYKLRATEEDYIHPGREGFRYIARIIHQYLLDSFLQGK